MTREQEAVLEKIRKLHEHAESAKEIGSEAEAQAFAAKVQQLLSDYKLSMSDLPKAQREQEEINITWFGWADLGMKTRRVRVNWTVDLASLIGRTYYCKFVIAGGASSGHGHIGCFIGTETDRKVALYMFTFIARFLEPLAEREYSTYYRKIVFDRGLRALPPGTNNFKGSFIYGFIQRLRERFDEEVRQATKADASRSMAIVHIKKDALARADEWMKENMKTTQSRRATPRTQRDGIAAGRRAADDVNLNRPLNASGGKKGELR